jgi:hypothetical protein
MRLAIWLFVFLSTMALTGCPRKTNSVSRESTEFSQPPSATCISKALASVRGITGVKYNFEYGGRELTLSGIQKPDEIHRYSYELGSGMLTVLYFVVGYNNRTTIHNALMCADCGHESFKALHPLMLQIENAMEHQCSLPDLSESAKEYCSGTGCDGS